MKSAITAQDNQATRSGAMALLRWFMIQVSFTISGGTLNTRTNEYIKRTMMYVEYHMQTYVG